MRGGLRSHNLSFVYFKGNHRPFVNFNANWLVVNEYTDLLLDNRLILLKLGLLLLVDFLGFIVCGKVIRRLLGRQLNQQLALDMTLCLHRASLALLNRFLGHSGRWGDS